MSVVAILAAAGVCFVVLVIAIELLARRRARKRAEWHRHYFHEGGLIRALMARWSGPAKITYRPIEEDSVDG